MMNKSGQGGIADTLTLFRTIEGLFTADSAIHTNIMKYEKKVAKDAGTWPYAVRLIYGPFDYVKEKF